MRVRETKELSGTTDDRYFLVYKNISQKLSQTHGLNYSYISNKYFHNYMGKNICIGSIFFYIKLNTREIKSYCFRF